MVLTKNRLLNHIKLLFLTAISSDRLMCISMLFIMQIIYNIICIIDTHELTYSAIIIIISAIIIAFEMTQPSEKLRWKIYGLNISMIEDIRSIYIPYHISIHIVCINIIPILSYIMLFLSGYDFYIVGVVIALWLEMYHVYSCFKYQNLSKQSNNTILINIGDNCLTVEFDEERGVYHEFRNSIF